MIIMHFFVAKLYKFDILPVIMNKYNDISSLLLNISYSQFYLNNITYIEY